MNKIKNLSESRFLKLFFACITLCFLAAAVCMPDRRAMFTGLLRIISQPCKVPTSYFAVGGLSATFLNMGLVALFCALLFSRAEPDGSSTLVFILTVGFGAWGIHVLNMWFSMPGVLVYGWVRKEKLKNLIHPMLFSTGLAPLITDLLIRYPNDTVVGFSLSGVALALVVGFVIGFGLPAGLEKAHRIHLGYSLYSAALPVGMTAFFLQAALYETAGIPLPEAPDPETLQITARLTVNLFCGGLFLIFIVAARLMGCRFARYRELLTSFEPVKDIAAAYGNEVFLMNVGVYGLFILGYYNLIGAEFNGVTFGIVFCMLATCNSGSNPANVLPILMGYAFASWVFGGFSALMGGSFAVPLNSQAIVVGVCYANGLSPISDKYGWGFGTLAAFMHYVLVTSVPNLHGGFCLYNGGFTAALICIILIPELERFCRTKKERREARLLRAR